MNSFLALAPTLASLGTLYPLTPEAHAQGQEQPSIVISPYCLLNPELTSLFFDGTTARFSCAPIPLEL